MIMKIPAYANILKFDFNHISFLIFIFENNFQLSQERSDGLKIFIIEFIIH